MKIKKLLLLTSAIFFSYMSQATDYKFLTIEDNTGHATSLSITNLTITFVDGNFVTNDGITLPLSSLSKMYFTETSGITTLTSEMSGEVTAYSTSGALIGHFSNADEATKSLKKGIYIVKDKNGNTYKTAVK